MPVSEAQMRMAIEEPESTKRGAYAWSALLVAGITGVALLGRDAFHLPDVVMLYLLAILVAAFRFGRGPSIVAAALCVASYDFFLVPPLHTFSGEHARPGHGAELRCFPAGSRVGTSGAGRFLRRGLSRQRGQSGGPRGPARHCRQAPTHDAGNNRPQHGGYSSWREFPHV